MPGADLASGTGGAVVGMTSPGGSRGAWFSVRLIQGMLFETTFADPATIVGVVAVLTSVTLLASYRPALRATRTDPMLAIRSD